MTPFFRRIRQKLANENKFLKYSRYAIGEIVLVVIGILIALQINTWNENQQDRKEINGLLSIIAYDITSDIAVLDSVNTFTDSVKYHSLKYFELAKRNDLTMKDFYKVMHPNYSMFRDVRFRSTRRGYNTLNNSELSTKIDNSQLESALFKYYEHAEIMEDFERNRREWINKNGDDLYGELGILELFDFAMMGDTIHITEDMNIWFNKYKTHPKLSNAHATYIDDLGLQQEYIQLKTQGNQILDMINSIE